MTTAGSAFNMLALPPSLPLQEVNSEPVLSLTRDESSGALRAWLSEAARTDAADMFRKMKHRRGRVQKRISPKRVQKNPFMSFHLGRA